MNHHTYAHIPSLWDFLPIQVATVLLEFPVIYSYYSYLIIYFMHSINIVGFPGGSEVKNPPANAWDTGDVGLIPGQEDPLEEEMATCSSILAGKSHGQRILVGYNSWGCNGGRNGNLLQYSCWKIPWTEDPGGLQFMRLQRAGHNWAHTHISIV